MTETENQENTLQLGESSADEDKNASNRPTFAKAALVFLPIGFFIIGGTFIFKEMIGESIANGFLKSKGIDGKIDIAKINTKEIAIKHIELKKDNKPSLIAENAVIKWHLGKKFAPHIDAIISKSLTLNLAYDENGFDFGALEEFLKPSDKKSNLAIHDIDIGNLAINLKTAHGDIIANGNIKGALEKGLRGAFLIDLPKKIAPNQHSINYHYSVAPISEGKSFLIGNAINIGNLSLNEGLIKGLHADNVSGDLVFAFIAPKSPSLGARLLLLNSDLSAKKFQIAGLDTQNFNIGFESGWVNLGQNPQRDIVFDLKGNANAASLKFASNAFNNLNIDYSAARAKAGNIRLKLNADSQRINSAINTGRADIEGIIDFVAPDLSKPIDMSFNGIIDTSAFSLSGALIQKVKSSLQGTGFEDFFSNPNLKAKWEISSNGKTLSIKPLEKLMAYSSDSNLSFVPNPVSGFYIGLEKGGANQFQLAGRLVAKSSNAASLTANLNAVEYKSDKLFANIAEVSAKNFKAAGYKFNLDSAHAIFEMHGSNITKADFETDLNSRDKDLNFDANIKGAIINNNAKFDIKGYSKFFAINHIKGQSLRFDIIGNGNVKSQITANGNFDIQSLGSKSFTSKKIDGDFDIKLNTNDLSSRINSAFDIAHFASQNLLMENGRISSDGNLGLKKSTHYNGNIHANFAKMRIEDNMITEASIDGPIDVMQNASKISLNSETCLALDFKEYVANGLSLTSSRAQICPDNQSRILAFDGPDTILYANTEIGAAGLSIGSGDDATRVLLNDFKGKFIPSAGNVISFSGKSNALQLQFKTAPDNWASIVSNNADFDLVNTNDGTQIRAKLGDLSSKGLPVILGGFANGKFSVQNGVTKGEFDIKDLSVKDSERIKRFEDIIVNGQGEIADNKVTIFGDATLKEKGIDFAQIFLNHDLKTQKGGVLIDAPKLEFGKKLPGFDNKILQAKDIVPAISALFGQSYGGMSASSKFEWAPNQKIVSNANIKAENLTFESAQGSINKINGEIIIDDLINLKTSKSQNFKVGSFDVGIPIENGDIGISLNGYKGVIIDKAEWPFADGVLSLVPTEVQYGKSDLQFAVNVKSIDMAKLLRLTKIPNLEIEGKMSGLLPVYLVDNGFEIRGGILKADAGGVMRYTGPSPVPATPKAKGIEKIRNRIFGEPPPPPAEMAFSALRNLQYKILELRIDGRTTGDATMSILLEGNNPDVIGGHGFRFNIKIQVPLNTIVSAYNNFSKSPSQFLNYKEVN